MLGELFEGVLGLAPQYSTSGTPAMVQRQHLLGEASQVVKGWIASVASTVASGQVELRVKAGGRQSQVAPVAWIRIYSPAHSPATTAGFYLVYLFSGDGTAVYLSLNQGTSEYRANKWRPVTDASELLARAQSARATLGAWDSDLLSDGWADIDLAVEGLPVGPESKLRAPNYELANVIAVPYLAGAMPDDSELLSDLQRFGPLLGELYGTDPPGPGAVGSSASSGPAPFARQGRRRSRALGRGCGHSFELTGDRYACHPSPSRGGQGWRRRSHPEGLALRGPVSCRLDAWV